MDESCAGIRVILKTEKIVYKAKKKIITKPVGNATKVDNNKAELILGEDFRKINSLLDRFKLKCTIPLREFCDIKNGKILAWLIVNGKKKPAIIEKKDKIEFAFDLGKTFLELLNERYYDNKEVKHQLSNPIIENIYKKLPYILRILIYKRYYKNIHKNLNKSKGFITAFPIDPAGYILHNLFIDILKKNSDYAAIGYWPGNHKAAFMLTHDVEPTKFSYKKGIFMLLDNLKINKSTINFVSKYAKDYIINKFETENEIGCHGYIHDRNFEIISSKERVWRISNAKKILCGLFKKEIIGFRSPALQKSKDMFRILLDNGFKYDMSMIDSQREEPNCGRGISYNLPYYPFDFENKKFEGVLEIPTTAPDCISPVYFGYSLKETMQLFEKKMEWVSEINGVCNFIIHAPAWGEKDAEKRIWLLDKIQNANKTDFWVVTGNEINDWWRKRENVIIKLNEDKIKLKSEGDIEGLVVLFMGNKHIINLKAKKWLTIR